jgi:hypothetical protein
VSVPITSTRPQPKPAIAPELFVAAVAEASPAGQPIYRHHAGDANRRVPRDPAAIRAIAEHIRTHLGVVDSVLEAKGDEPLPVDLHLVEPRREMPIRLAVTSGMSNHAMNTPPGAEEARHVELILGLQPTWPVGKESLRQEHNAWPLDWLKRLATLPHAFDTWLGWGHTVPNGEPPEPLGPNTKMCGWILLPPLWLPEEAWTLAMNEHKTVQFLAPIALYPEEIDFKLREGAEALLDRLAELPLTGLFDFQRPNVCKNTVTIPCSCGTQVEAPARLAGRRVPCPTCGNAVIVPRRGFYDEKKRSFTLDDQTTASLPGNVRVNPLRYARHFPTWPDILAGSVVLLAASALTNPAYIVLSFLMLVVNGFYWYRVKEHFLHGCINPAVVVNTNPLLIAVSTDLTTGWKPWPVIKILRHPLKSIAGRPPQVGMRLSTVALYQASLTDDSHWSNFQPIAVECVTTDAASIRHTMSQLGDDSWRELECKLRQVPQPWKPGLYHTPDV